MPREFPTLAVSKLRPVPMTRLSAYQLEDAYGNLRALAALNLLLAFCIAAPDVGRIFTHFHIGVLVVQSILLLTYLRLDALQTKAVMIGILAIFLLTTVIEVAAWVQGLDGVVKGSSGGKGAPFAFVLQSPPYLYPIIRMGSLLLFLPVFRTFGSGVWER